MPTTILLLLFTFLFSSASHQSPESTKFEFHLEDQLPSSWTPLHISQAKTNPQIQSLLSIGVQNVTQQAVQDGSLPNGTYSVAKVNSIERNQEATDVQEYRFNVDVSNGQETTETIIFEIAYDPVEGSSEVTSYSISGQETEQELQETEIETEELYSFEEEMLFGFVPLDLDQVSTDLEIQGLLQIGVRNATEQAIQNGSLPYGVYQIVQIISVQQNLNVMYVEEYRFDVNISSDEGSTLSNLVFEIAYDPTSESSQVTSYSISNNYTPTSSTETYTPLDIFAVSTNPQIQGLLAIGVQNVTQQAIQNYSLPNGTYQLGQIYSISQGTLNPNDYQFNVSVQDNNGTTAADISFTLVYNNISGTTNVTSFSIANLVTKGTTETTAYYNDLPEGYIPVDMDSSEGTIAYQVGSDGFYSIQASISQSEELPYFDFYLTDINAVGKKQEDDVVYYWFDINIASGYGTSARLVFSMSYELKSGNEYVLFYDLYDVV